ncbi:MAG: hypothetical protein N3A66_07365, partial [Planctomycetota bacterium]|nr:hypothetical protein [Planctomycetota bacterium]
VRALELAENIPPEEASRRVAQLLGDAQSNYAGSATAVIEKYVRPQCYSAPAVAAAHIFCRLLDLPLPSYQMAVSLSEEIACRPYRAEREARGSAGKVIVHDRRTGRDRAYLYYGAILSPSCAGIFFAGEAEKAQIERLTRLPPSDLTAAIASESIRPPHLPRAEREQILARLFAEEESAFTSQVSREHQRSAPMLRAYAAAELTAPPLLRSCAEHIMAAQATEAWQRLLASGGESAEARSSFQALRQEARELGVEIALAPAARLLAAELRQRIAAFSLTLDETAIAAVRRLVGRGRQYGIEPTASRDVQEAFWNFLHGAARLALQEKSCAEQRRLAEALAALGNDLRFSALALKALDEIMAESGRVLTAPSARDYA